ncbi:MAG: chemotaxis protein CheW [Nitrospirota bacterium]
MNETDEKEKTMAETVTTDATQYLTFTLGDEEFALDIAKVREVLDYTVITKVPRMPDYMRGVINLRGNVVPVMDLRMKLGMSATEKTVNACIVIVEIKVEDEVLHMGALADSVEEVLDLDPRQVEPPPKLGTGINQDFIRGMGKRDDKFIIILDIDKVLSGEDMSVISKAGDESLLEKEEQAA